MEATLQKVKNNDSETKEVILNNIKASNVIMFMMFKIIVEKLYRECEQKCLFWLLCVLFQKISLQTLNQYAEALKTNTHLEKLHMANVKATDRVAKVFYAFKLFFAKWI